METIGQVLDVVELSPPKVKTRMYVVKLDDGFEKGYSKFGACPQDIYGAKDKTAVIDYVQKGEYRNINSIRLEGEQTSLETKSVKYKPASEVTESDDEMDGFVMEACALIDKFREAGVWNDVEPSFGKLFGCWQMSDHKTKQSKALLDMARRSG